MAQFEDISLFHETTKLPNMKISFPGGLMNSKKTEERRLQCQQWLNGKTIILQEGTVSETRRGSESESSGRTRREDGVVTTGLDTYLYLEVSNRHPTPLQEFLTT